MLSLVFLVSVLLGSNFPVQDTSTATSVSEDVARQHLLNYVDPVYPPIAKAAHITGEVLLSVTIDSRGHVFKAETLSGPAMLMAASIDAVKQWTFSPFDSTGPIKTEISIKFEIPSPRRIIFRFPASAVMH
jgi:TonB family protein